MNNRFISNQYITQVEDSAKNNSPSNSGDSDSPTSALAKPPKIPSKIRRGAMGKRVISVPIKEVERLRLKGDHVSSPPSDSWAWRKYGQKPIKGSPYPRGYYRCSSSSKACPARKQVERSRENPNMLIVTYSCEHNHPPPSSRNTHHRAPPLAAPGNSVSEDELEEEEEEEKNRDVLVRDQSKELISDNKFSMINGGDQFGWLTDFESPSSVILESPVLMEERRCTEREMAMIFSMGEDESGLFADLGELPECSTVFRRGVGLREAEQRRRSEAMCGP